MGTPEFSVPSLKKLIELYQVTGVITQPDRPKGRGKKSVFSPIKDVALEHNIPVFQPEKIKNNKEIIEEIKNLAPDFIIVVAFGQILSKEILDIPKYGCINLHASLLPKHRGAAPINWSIIEGDKKSGNTTMLMDVGLDTGDMLLKHEVNITNEMTYGELHDILSISGADLLINTISKYAKGEIIPEKQNNEDTSYAKMLQKNMCGINWNKPAYEISNLIRGLNPRPVAYTSYENNTMKIYKAISLDKQCKHEPGYIAKVSKAGIEVETAKGVLLINSLQFPGGKVLTVDEFLRGNEIKEGMILPSFNL